MDQDAKKPLGSAREAVSAAIRKPLPSPARAPSLQVLPPGRPATAPPSEEDMQGSVAPATSSSTGALHRHFRITILASRSGKTACTQLSELALKCGLSGQAVGLEDFKVKNPKGQSPNGEGAEKILTPSGKWLDFNFRKREQSVLLLDAPREFSFDGIAFRTANDQPARDPVRLRVEGCSVPSAALAPVIPRCGKGARKQAGRKTGDASSKCSKATTPGGDGWVLLFEGVVEAPLARRAWTEWVPLQRAGQQPLQKEAPVVACAPPTPDAPLEDLLHMLLHVGPGCRIDVKATVDAVGELEVQDLRLQPGESTASRTLNLRLRDGAVCGWRLWGGSAEKHGKDLLGQQVIVRGARAMKFNRKCLLNGCSGVEVCT